MAVDEKARISLRNALANYMKRETRSFSLDDAVSQYLSAKTTPDESVRRVAAVIWQTYDDFMDHPVSVTYRGWEMYRRVVAFLFTDLQVETDSDRDNTWPFRDREEWERHKGVLCSVDLPEYDVRIHGRPANRWWNGVSSGIGFAAILGATLLFVVAFLLLNR